MTNLENNEPYYDDDEHMPFYQNNKEIKSCTNKCCSCDDKKGEKESPLQFVKVNH
jgi:hypothetical protein